MIRTVINGKFISKWKKAIAVKSIVCLIYIFTSIFLSTFNLFPINLTGIQLIDSDIVREQRNKTCTMINHKILFCNHLGNFRLSLKHYSYCHRNFPTAKNAKN